MFGMAPTRKAAKAEAAETAAENKRYRQVMNEMADELVCSITQELPVDPVMAEDGRVYERQAMEEWLQSKAGQAVRSPVTNEPMGTRLLPAVQVRNNIKGMVKSGAIRGDKVEAWQRRMEEEEEVAAERKKAEEGDADAMCKLGEWYEEGKKGLALDDKQAAEWWRRAADLDHPTATACLGDAYRDGVGVDEDEARALVLIGMAAGLGSAFGCYLLGLYHLDGYCGLAKDPKETARWYRKAQSSSLQDTGEVAKKIMARWLREHAEA